jgi:hypothetical protein
MELNADSLFKYTPLSPGEYRILVLMPASLSQGLRCALITGPPHCLPPYEAVSYAWNGTDRQNLILCNNAVGNLKCLGDLDMVFSTKFECRVKFTGNLEALLLRFRHASKCRYLWIDSICINQDDLQERGAQVQMMADIYYLSQQVLIWLGEEDQNTNTAFRFDRPFRCNKPMVLRTYFTHSKRLQASHQAQNIRPY